MLTDREVKETLQQLGADLCGIADVERFGAAPQGFHPRDVMPGCRSVIAFAVEFPASTLACRSTAPYTLVRNQLSNRVDRIAVAFCEQMGRRGTLAAPTGAVGPTMLDERTGRYRNPISAKHAAQAAGLGVIGKNTLLITPEYGNMVWLGAILCDAELQSDAPLALDYCHRCDICVRACPVGAVGEPELKQLDCSRHAFRGGQGEDFLIVCHRCRSLCPHCLGSRNQWLRDRIQPPD
mgnify:CR=1 FL=1